VISAAWRRSYTRSRDAFAPVLAQTADMMSIVLLIILVAGAAGVLTAFARAISAATFGRSLQAAHVSPPTTLATERDRRRSVGMNYVEGEEPAGTR
jgi:hypothetical protein